MKLHRIFLILSTAAWAAGPLRAAENLAEITQFGITWKFDKAYPAGRFANGDYWVVGPVTITSINPPSTTAKDRTRNGSMINPAVGADHGYDSSKEGGKYASTYSAKLNVALGVSAESPLVVKPGSSLISTISHDEEGRRPQLSDAAILTVLAEPAPEGAFRPSPVGSDKSAPWNVSQIDWAALKSLPAPSGAPDPGSIADKLERPWLEQNPNWTGRTIHPSNNQPDYGRDMSMLLGDALLLAHLDFSTDKKRTLVIRLIQYGLDVYGSAKNGAIWVGYGGHNQGRKMPMIFAGLLLKDKDILAWADAREHFIFQEDHQTWIVQPSDVGRALYNKDDRPREPYTSEDVGLPEWGEQHTKQPERDGRNWEAYYRRNVGSSTLAHALVARLMGAEKIWNWPPFFGYMDRYWGIEKDVQSGTDALKPFHRSLWAEHGTPKSLP